MTAREKALILATLAALAAQVAHAERSLKTSADVSHEAVERTGDDFARHIWGPVEKTGDGETVLNYSSSIDGKLTMDHQASARAQVLSGLELGAPGQGPQLKAILQDDFQFSGTAISREDGAVWARTESGQSAKAAVTTDLSFAAGSPLAHRLLFYWRVDGQVSFNLRAPQVPVFGAPDNPLSVSAQVLDALAIFSAYQVDCAACGASDQGFPLGVVGDPEVWRSHPNYDYRAKQSPTVIFVPFIVGNDPDPSFPKLTFALAAYSWYVMDNGDYQNLKLDGSMQVAFDNSAALLGVLPLDAQGNVVPGVRLVSSDPDFSFPMLSEVPAVPEPSTYALVLAGLAALVARARRKSAAAPRADLA